MSAKVCVFFVAVLLTLAAPVYAAALIEHSGDTDPTTEGWMWIEDGTAITIGGGSDVLPYQHVYDDQTTGAGNWRFWMFCWNPG